MLFRVLVFFATFSLCLLKCDSAALSYSLTSDDALSAFESFNEKFGLIIDSEKIYNKFFDILKRVAGNPVGKFVLISVINKLQELVEQKKFNDLTKLEISIDNFNPGFVRPVISLNKPAKLQFSEIPIACFVISDGDDTTSELTQPDVLLFHELLHWARSLICKLPSKDIESRASFYDTELQDHPLVNVWKKIILDDYNTAKNNPAKRIGINFKYTVINFHMVFPTLNCWKNSASLVNLSPKWFEEFKKQYEEFPDGDIVKLLKMPSINIEEVRNVVGGKFSDGSVCYHTSIHDTIMHDVCENGYRLFVSLKLRYGHVDVSCPIDSAIKSWCMARAEKCIQAVKYLGG